VNKTQQKKSVQLSSNIIAKFGKDEPMSIETRVKTCVALEVDIGYILNLEENNNIKDRKVELFASGRKYHGIK